MASSDLELVRSLFRRLADGGLDVVLEVVSPDFVLTVPSSMSAEPDTYVGHDGARRYFAGFDGQLVDVRWELLEIFDSDQGVVISMVLHGRGESSGIEVQQPAAAVVVVRDGKVVRIDPHPDIEAAREAVG